jgi:hypothetical protein
MNIFSRRTHPFHGEFGGSVQNHVEPRAGSTLTIAAAMSTVLAVVTLVLASPLFMHWALGDGSTWKDVSDLGQAYSGAAALMSALALVGVAVSVMLQWRSLQGQLKAHANQRHFDIVKLAIEIPELRTAGTGTEDPVLALKWRQANLWVTYWAELWDIREISEQGLRNIVAANLAGDPVAHDWWLGHMARGGWSNLKGRRRQRFEQIVTEELAKAAQQPVTLEPRTSESSVETPN